MSTDDQFYYSGREIIKILATRKDRKIRSIYMANQTGTSIHDEKPGNFLWIVFADGHEKSYMFRLDPPSLRKHQHYICGMVPWMFWVLVVVASLAVFGPEIFAIIKHLLHAH